MSWRKPIDPLEQRTFPTEPGMAHSWLIFPFHVSRLFLPFAIAMKVKGKDKRKVCTSITSMREPKIRTRGEKRSESEARERLCDQKPSVAASLDEILPLSSQADDEG